MIRRILAAVRCLLTGHKPFVALGNAISFVEPKEIGNQIRSLQICNRCDALYVSRSEISQAELDEEKKALAKMDKIKEELAKFRDDTMEQIAVDSTTKHGKPVLN